MNFILAYFHALLILFLIDAIFSWSCWKFFNPRYLPKRIVLCNSKNISLSEFYQCFHIKIKIYLFPNTVRSLSVTSDVIRVACYGSFWKAQFSVFINFFRILTSQFHSLLFLRHLIVCILSYCRCYLEYNIRKSNILLRKSTTTLLLTHVSFFLLFTELYEEKPFWLFMSSFWIT